MLDRQPANRQGAVPDVHVIVERVRGRGRGRTRDETGNVWIPGEWYNEPNDMSDDPLSGHIAYRISADGERCDRFLLEGRTIQSLFFRDRKIYYFDGTFGQLE